MDKIRDNAFGIAVSVLSIGALALIWFLIVSPLFGALDAGRVEASLRKLENYANSERTPEFPTEELVERKSERQERLKQALVDAKEFYAEKREQFSAFFDEFFGAVPETAEFAAKYQTEIASLKEAYMEKYPEARPPEEEAGLRRRRGGEAEGLRVQEVSVFADESHVIRGMKEFWIIQHIFDTVNKLDIGGLKGIVFPPKGKELEDLPPQYQVIRSQVTLHMPMAKVDDFLREVLRSERVPFLLQNCEVRRDSEGILKEYIVEKEYGSDSFAEQQQDLASHPGEEPPMEVIVELWALDWIGLQEKEE